MIDIFNIPNNLHSNQIFYTTASGATNQWQIWNKPSGCNFVFFTVIGGGGAGGSGTNNTGASATAGAGGGGSSSITKGFFSAINLPDTLYIQVGAGGSTNRTSGGAGNNGSLSYVSVLPNTTSINILLQSGAVAAFGGTGAGTGARNGGVGGTVFTSTILSSLGIIESEAGQQGGGGGNGTNGGNVTMLSILTGGAGGAGTDTNVDGRGFLGGNITCSGFVRTISGGTATNPGASTGGTGNNFLTLIPTVNLSNSLPFFSSGGSGGGSGNVGGSGANGNYGSGGGGAGNARTAVVNNFGGRGGDGIVIITCI